MKRIIISESDLTSNVEMLSSYDVVYVPGFTKSEEAMQAYYRKPTLFTNLYTFINEIGRKGSVGNDYIPTFSSPQEYPKAKYESGSATQDGFPDIAIPTTTTERGDISYMFKENDADSGFLMASYLLSLGLPVYYEVMNSTTEEITVSKMYEGLKNRFGNGDNTELDTSFDTPGDYAIKFITSGGYPVFEYGTPESKDSGQTISISMYLMEGMLEVARTRGDAIALIDHTNNPDRALTASEENSVISKVRKLQGASELSYGAMFTPWYVCSSATVHTGELENGAVYFPGSVAYLSALAIQLRDYNPWSAVSGTTRGIVPNIDKLHTTRILTNNIADSYQSLPSDMSDGNGFISINPITYIRNVGYCIWGNRTLRNNADGTKALSSLNLRSAVADIKKVLYDASRDILFEQNTDITWINFKSKVTPLLDRMLGSHIIDDYSIVRYMYDPQSGLEVPSYKILGVIKIRPINSIEVLELEVRLDNANTTIE